MYFMHKVYYFLDSDLNTKIGVKVLAVIFFMLVMGLISYIRGKLGKSKEKASDISRDARLTPGNSIRKPINKDSAVTDSYFIKVDNSIAGPFEKDYLKNTELKASDLILRNGESIWRSASEFPELLSYIKSENSQEIAVQLICKGCEKIIPNDSLFCAYCGTKVFN